MALRRRLLLLPVLLVLISASLVTGRFSPADFDKGVAKYYSFLDVADPVEINMSLRIFVGADEDIEKAHTTYLDFRNAKKDDKKKSSLQQLGEAITMEHKGGEVLGWTEDQEVSYKVKLYKETTGGGEIMFYILFIGSTDKKFHYGQLADFLEMVEERFSDVEGFEKKYFEAHRIWMDSRLSYGDAFSIIVGLTVRERKGDKQEYTVDEWADTAEKEQSHQRINISVSTVKRITQITQAYVKWTILQPTQFKGENPSLCAAHKAFDDIRSMFIVVFYTSNDLTIDSVGFGGIAELSAIRLDRDGDQPRGLFGWKQPAVIQIQKDIKEKKVLQLEVKYHNKTAMLELNEFYFVVDEEAEYEGNENNLPMNKIIPDIHIGLGNHVNLYIRE
eukprot:GHVS01048125.1.p1 GENE.GHVS01048125.1~~GHVS01048125.1.p1  ORF type:complete len:389 (+),score=44.00 GHVS01048125.1:166-1332(+)